MKAGVLFSGGKDSSLAAVLLSRDYAVELNTFAFSPERSLCAVERAACAMGLPWFRRTFREDLLDRAVGMVLACGYPNGAIQVVHREALRALAAEYRVIADGTRFDDRVPMLSRDEVQSLQDTTGCSYLRPLLGYPRREVDRLAARHLQIASGETGSIENGDYEAEIREGVRARGEDAERFFPQCHVQSLVTGTIDKMRVRYT